MNKFSNVLNKKIAAVVYDKYEILFDFEDGTQQGFRVAGDCCSNSWIEDFEMPDNVVGSIITSVEEYDMDPPINNYDNDNNDFIQVYQTQFKTTRGIICLEYRNSSNGYYGGYLEAI